MLTAADMTDRTKILDRIWKLQALATSPVAAEAASAACEASRLRVLYNITEVDLADHALPGMRQAGWCLRLAEALASLHGCFLVRRSVFVFRGEGAAAAAASYTQVAVLLEERADRAWRTQLLDESRREEWARFFLWGAVEGLLGAWHWMPPVAAWQTQGQEGAPSAREAQALDVALITRALESGAWAGARVAAQVGRPGGRGALPQRTPPALP